MSDKITLQELVESFARKCQLDPAEAALFVKEFLNLIEEALARDKYVKVKGLGTFKLINIEARKSKYRGVDRDKGAHTCVFCSGNWIEGLDK